MSSWIFIVCHKGDVADGKYIWETIQLIIAIDFDPIARTHHFFCKTVYFAAAHTGCIY